MNTISNALKKIANSSEVSEEAMSGEVWISPEHWAAMDEEQQCIIVDLWHNDNSYGKAFPFENMEAPTESYNAGVTFSAKNDNDSKNKISGSAAQATVEILKIPHSIFSYDDLEKARKKYMESKTKARD